MRTTSGRGSLAMALVALASGCSRSDVPRRAGELADDGRGGSGSGAGGAGEGASTGTTTSSSTGTGGAPATCAPTECVPSVRAFTALPADDGPPGASPEPYVLDVANDGCGTTAVLGHWFGSLDLGGAQFDVGLAGCYVVALDQVSGAVKWAKALDVGSTSDWPYHEWVRALAADAAGRVIVAGSFSSALVVDGVTVAATGTQSLFVASFGPSGALGWVRSFDGLDAAIADMAVDPWGRITVVGHGIDGSVDFGGGALAGTVFAATFASDGTYLHGEGFANQFAKAHAVVAAANGHTFVAGSFNDVISLPGLGAIVADGGPGWHDAFLVERDTDGTALWVRRYGGVRNDFATKLEWMPDGSLWMAGTFGESIDLGTQSLVAANSVEPCPFVAHLSPDGTPIGATALPVTGDALIVNAPTSLAPAGDGGVLVSLALGSSISGDEPQDLSTVRLDRVDAEGAVTSETYPAAGFLRVRAVDGGVVVAGGTATTFDFDATPIVAPAQLLATRCDP